MRTIALAVVITAIPMAGAAQTTSCRWVGSTE